MAKRTSLIVEETESDEAATPREAAHQPQGRAPRMAAHADEHEVPRARTRRRKSTVNEDQYYVPTEEIPEGLSYEWKRWSVTGQHDPFYIASMREQGWEPVPPKRHPNWVPPGYNEPHIIKGGMILMDRPMELTLEAKREVRQLSKRQVVEAEQRLGMTPRGEMTRDFEGARPKVVKEMMRPIAVED